MIRLLRIPEKFQAFFAPLAAHFNRHKTFQNFQHVVVAMALMWESRNISRMKRFLFKGPHRTRLNELLNSRAWNAEAVLHEIAKQALLDLHLKPGDTVRVILDDTKKAKRGKKMPGVGKYFDPVLKAYRKGHVYVTCFLEVKGHLIPWGIRLYLKKPWCQENHHPFKKLTELAAELLRSLPTFAKGVEVTVLFDSYYLCSTVTQAIPKDWFWISRLKSNRNIWIGREKRKAEKYARNLMTRRGGKISVRWESGKRERFFVAGKRVRLGEMDVYLVASRRIKENKVVALATNRLEAVDKKVIGEYGHRWIIEVAFKELKQHLGLGEYQTRSLEGAVKHLHLSLIAMTLLTHGERKRSRAQAKRKTGVAANSFSMERLQNRLRTEATRDTLLHLFRWRPTNRKKCNEIKELLMAA